MACHRVVSTEKKTTTRAVSEAMKRILGDVGLRLITVEMALQSPVFMRFCIFVYLEMKNALFACHVQQSFRPSTRLSACPFSSDLNQIWRDDSLGDGDSEILFFSENSSFPSGYNPQCFYRPRPTGSIPAFAFFFACQITFIGENVVCCHEN